MKASSISARVEQARPTYRVVVRRANDLPREETRDPGALWLVARGVSVCTFWLRRAHRRWRVELRRGDALVLSREVEHRTAARVLAVLWSRELDAGTTVDALP